ncbi:MAG: hypothetical protein MHM6MM_007328 [Cercozoa sp. M6MM]
MRKEMRMHIEVNASLRVAARLSDEVAASVQRQHGEMQQAIRQSDLSRGLAVLLAESQAAASYVRRLLWGWRLHAGTPMEFRADTRRLRQLLEDDLDDVGDNDGVDLVGRTDGHADGDTADCGINESLDTSILQTPSTPRRRVSRSVRVHSGKKRRPSLRGLFADL